MNPETRNTNCFGSHSRTDPIFRLLKLAKSKSKMSENGSAPFVSFTSQGTSAKIPGQPEEAIEMKPASSTANSSTSHPRCKSMSRLVKYSKAKVISGNTTAPSAPSSTRKNVCKIPAKSSKETKTNSANGNTISNSKKPGPIRHALNYLKSKIICGLPSQSKNATSVKKLNSLVCQRKLYIHLIISLRDLAVSLHSTAELDAVTAEMMFNHLTSLYESYLANETNISSMYHGDSCFDKLLEDVEEMQQKVFFLQVSLKKIMVNKSSFTKSEVNDQSNLIRKSRSKLRLNLQNENAYFSSLESESEGTDYRTSSNSIFVDCVVEVNSEMRNNNFSTEQINIPEGKESNDELSDGFEVIPPDSVPKKVELISSNDMPSLSESETVEQNLISSNDVPSSSESETVQQNQSGEKIEENISTEKFDVHEALQLHFSDEPIELASESHFE